MAGGGRAEAGGGGAQRDGRAAPTGACGRARSGWMEGGGERGFPRAPDLRSQWGAVDFHVDGRARGLGGPGFTQGNFRL